MLESWILFRFFSDKIYDPCSENLDFQAIENFIKNNNSYFTALQGRYYGGGGWHKAKTTLDEFRYNDTEQRKEERGTQQKLNGNIFLHKTTTATA